MGVEGSATSWTLRFKHRRTTVLLYTEALTPFADLKTELLTVLRERYPKGLPRNPIVPGKYIEIPDSPSDVTLGVLVNVNDPEKGWQELELGDGGIKDTPKAHGLKDGGVVAFRFRGEDEDEAMDDTERFPVEWPIPDDQYGDELQPDGIE